MFKKIKSSMNTIINGVDTPLGRFFDIGLIICIIISASIIIFSSLPDIDYKYNLMLKQMEVFFLYVFTIEYLLRLFIATKKMKYIFSFYGIIDFLAIAPMLMTQIIGIATFLPILRVMRLLRLFSVFKMGRYVYESSTLLRALKASKEKIIVFIDTIVFIVIIVGALMYAIEGPQNGFVSIPESMYWAIVTISTVGYGDISPNTVIGKMIASSLMIIGYGIIAVPTGIITKEYHHQHLKKKETFLCKNCGENNHLKNSLFCHQCGNPL